MQAERIPKPFLSVSLGVWLSVFGLCGSLVSENRKTWHEADGYRWRALTVSESNQVGFVPMTEGGSGVDFINALSDQRAAENQIRLLGSGVALGDVDGDGDVDLYCARLEGDNVLFLNRGGGRFEAADSGPIACPNQDSMGCAFADLDGDRDLDLLVTSLGGGIRFFKNDGAGEFIQVRNAGLHESGAATSIACGDLDGDTDLDIYVTMYRSKTIRSTGLEMLLVNGQRVLKPEDRETMYITEDGFLREHGEIDAVYFNDGNGFFTKQRWSSGAFLDENGMPVSDPKDWGLAVGIRDLNNDRLPDIYTCNDFWSPDRLWINEGGGTFRAIARESLPMTSSFSMGIDFSDLNGDGRDDFLVLDMLSPDYERRMRQVSVMGLMDWPTTLTGERPQAERNTLLMSRRDGSYGEVALFAGVSSTEWSWCPIFVDVDLDGDSDLLVSNGYGFDTQDGDAEALISARGPFPAHKVPTKLLMRPRLPLSNFAFRNLGEGRFEDVSQEWGFNTLGISQGMALGDLDGDGDQDVVINNMNAPLGLYRNVSGAPRIAVSLVGADGNRFGIGSKVILTTKSGEQRDEMNVGGRYLSSDAPTLSFAGIGASGGSLRVEWRSGASSVIASIEPNRFYEIVEPSSAELRPTEGSQDELPFFADQSALIDFVHEDQAFDDRARQSGLLHHWSRLGSGLAWFDFDQDGDDDLIAGSGRGGRMGCFENIGQGRFKVVRSSPFNRPVTRDQTSIVGYHGRNQSMVLAAASNYEDGLAVGPRVRGYDIRSRRLLSVIEGNESMAGPLCLVDIDGDGDLDAFVGGSVRGGRMPTASGSGIYLDVSEKQPKQHSQNEALFTDVGMVIGAVWSDLFEDGYPELILTTHWGAIRVFDNVKGTFAEITEKLGLDQFKGLWTGITTADLNNDGRLDILAGNIGRNSRFEAYGGPGIRLYHGDYDGNGSIEIIPSYFESKQGRWVPLFGRDNLALGLPGLLDRFPTYSAFGKASLSQVINNAGLADSFLEANCLESSLFLNRGRDRKVERRPLPLVVQMAPVFGIVCRDFDGDGNTDLVVGQNILATHPALAPMASGRGEILWGDGRGAFKDSEGKGLSGFSVRGAARGLGVSDYDKDGRIDIAVAQNGESIKLFRNLAGAPGVSVKINGPKSNPAGIGCVIRVTVGSQTYVREIKSGEGFWSQSSATQYFPEALVTSANSIDVRWPGGRIQSAKTDPERKTIPVIWDES